MSLKLKVIAISLFALLIAGCAQNGQNSQSYDSQIALSDDGFVKLSQLDWSGYADQIDPMGLEQFEAYIKPGIEMMILQTQADSVNLFGKFFNSQEIQSKSSKEFFVTMMDLLTEVSPEIKSTFNEMTNDAIGAVAESDSLVHIVIKTNLNMAGRSVDEMNIQSVVKMDDGWKLVISPKIIGIAQFFAQAMAPR